MAYIRLAIDLAIRQSGYVITCDFGNNIVRTYSVGIIDGKPWESNQKYYDFLVKQASQFITYINKAHIHVQESKLQLIIELSNFSNPLNTQRMSFIAGIIIGYIKREWPNAEVKITNANGWFHWFNRDYVHEKNWTKLPREKRKELAIKEYKRALKEEFKFENDNAHKFYENLNESEKSDIADAYWLGVYYDKL